MEQPNLINGRIEKTMTNQSKTSTNCAYLLGGTVPHFTSDYADMNPQSEFQEFMRRNESTAYDFSSLTDSCSSILLRRLKQKFQFALVASRWRNASNVSIVSGEDIGMLCALVDLVTGSKKPIVIITHGSYFGSKYWKYFARILAAQRHVHWACLSQSLAAAMVDDYGFSQSNVHDTGYGVDTNFFKPAAKTTSKPMILAAGTANRDYKTLVSAVEDIDIELRIAADSAWYPVATNINGVTLPDNVIVKSAGNYTGLRQLYGLSQFVVVPMHDAKFACGYAVIVEAMAMGKAVIATRTSSVSDFIIDGENGFLVDVGDVAALHERIKFLVEHPEVASTMGARARFDIEQSWSLPSYTSRLETAVIAASGHFKCGVNSDTAPSSVRFGREINT